MNSQQVDFISSRTFQGRREGYVFKNGDKGIGYYVDKLNPFLAIAARKNAATNSSKSDEDVNRKRKVPDSFSYDMNDEAAVSKRVATGVSSSSSDDVTKADLDIEESKIVQLDANSLKQLLVSFEKKITKNQKLRIKHSDEPEKFMESEFELHKEIEELHVVAASPELYPILVQTNAMNSILGLITHENTDISIAAVSLLQELTDVDTIAEQQEQTLPFIDALAKEPPGFELLVQNLFRLDETNNEDAQGVHDTFEVIENIIEIQPLYANDICERTPILKFLLNRLKTKIFDDNKLYASEILSILLQSSPENNRRLAQLDDLDGVDALLQCIAIYRRKHLERQDEQECCENLFLALFSVLLDTDNQIKFMECEGFELLMKCLEEQEYAAGCTIKCLSYAVMRNRAGCERFVQVGGLKYIFAILMGKGLKKSLRKKVSGEKRNVEESAISIVAQLCTQLFQSTTGDVSVRITAKFVENNFEKLRTCVDYYLKHRKLLDKTDADLEKTRQLLMEEGDEEALADFEDEDNILVQRLDGGLFMLQQLSLMLVFAIIMDKSCLHVVASRLDSDNVDIDEPLNIIRDMILTLRDEIEASDNNSDDKKSNGNRNGRDKLETTQYLETLTAWTAAFNQLLETELIPEESEDGM